MSREHAVAERPATVAIARETRTPVREAHQARSPERGDERGPSTRERLATALLGEERPAVTTRDRVATAVRIDEPTPAPTRGEHREARRLSPQAPHRAPLVRTRPSHSHPPGRISVDRPRGPARARAPPRVFTKLDVTDPADAWEAHADAVAALVLRDASHHGQPAPPSGAPTGSDVATTEEAQAAVEQALAGTGGFALPDAVRRRVEPLLQADLSRVQVRQDAATITAARALGARAFTVGRTIHLGPGASAHDLGLMAHEATHVFHQGLAPARAPPVVMRAISVTDVIPDSVLDAVRSLIRAIPGYTALTYVVGQDLLTGEPVHVDVDALLDAVLTRGPFGPAVATVLRALSIAQEIFTAVSAAFAAHNLTLARINRDIKAAWGELSFTRSIDGNVAVVRRYIDALLSDLRALVSDLVDQVLALARRAVVAVAEPFLQRPSVAPVWNLAKEVLHYDPLRGVGVHVPTVQIIADFLTLIGQTERLEQMRQRGTLQETADWLDAQIATFRSIVTEVGALFSQAWNAIQPVNLPNLLDTLPSLADRAIGVVRRIADFATTLIAKVLELVKKALLSWLSEHAHRVPGFHLLTVIIGQNPFTGEAVPRTPVNLIKGFITLLPNGEATYDELEKSGVVTEAAGRIEAAMVRLGISLDMVIATFRGVWDTLSLDDLRQPIAAFQRVVAQFGQPLARIIEFVGVVLRVVVELILRLMNFPTDLLAHIVTNAMQAIEDIKRDPAGFLKNVLAAMKLGFTMFFDHIGKHLLNGLKDWLFRGLKGLGIVIPADLTLKSVLTLVLQVLDITAEKLWTKLGEQIGPENVALIRQALDVLTGVWEFIKDVQENGISAVWKFLTDQLANLWNTLLSMAIEWITKTVIGKAVTKLLTFLDPTGIMAVINSCVAFFNAVQSAIEYLRDMLEIVDRYVSTIAAVAAGNITPGAQMLEGALAAAVPVAIGFLANQVGLGNIPEMVVEVIGKLRELVDKAITWLIKKAIDLGKAALKALGVGKDKKTDPEAQGPLNRAQAAMKGKLTGHEHPDQIRTMLATVQADLQPAGLNGLELRGPDESGKYDLYGSASPWRLLTAFAKNVLDKGTMLRVTLHVASATAAYGRQQFTRPFQYRDQTGSRLAYAELDAQGREIGVVFPRPGEQPPAGGVVERPAAGSTRLELLTFNAQQAGDSGNLSHAEYKLFTYLTRNSALASSVQQIDATLNYSPCSRCSDTLNRIAGLTTAADGRRFLTWVIPWRGTKFPTSDKSLGRIQNWALSSTTVPPITPAEEAQEELRGIEWETIIEPLHAMHPSGLAPAGKK